MGIGHVDKQLKLGNGRWGFVKLLSLILYMFEYFH